MIVEAEGLDVTRYATQYECLRTQFTGSMPDIAPQTCQPRGLGLVLLLREGMHGWLKAVHEMLRASGASRAGGTRVRAAQRVPSMLPNAQHHDLTTLLASLVLSTRRLPDSSPSPCERYRPCR